MILLKINDIKSMEILGMSQKEIKQYGVINRLIHKEINGSQAAELLKISTRHVRRLKVKVKKKGAKGLIHGKRGKPSSNKIPVKEKGEIKRLLHETYPDFKPGFAAEKLAENHGINRDPKTIRTIMIEEGLWKPRKKKKGKDYRSWRQRKTNYGEMQQFDGSYEHWLENRNSECCLLLSVDDATGKITKAQFAEHEGVFPVFRFWKEYVQENGKPWSIYLDKFSTYSMNQKTAKENSDTKTRFGRAIQELQIEPITAHSPQAKGRVERMFRTLQDRLIKELRLAKISDIATANELLVKIFIPKYNTKFSIEPRKKADLHTKLKVREIKKLDSIFSRQETRIVQNDYCIYFQNHWFQLLAEQPIIVCKKDQVIVEEHLNGEIKIRLKGKYLNYKELSERPRKSNQQPWILVKNNPAKRTWKPAQNHPWRNFNYSNSLNPKAKVGHF